MKKLLSFIIALLFLPPLAQATPFYVNSAGSDGIVLARMAVESPLSDFPVSSRPSGKQAPSLVTTDQPASSKKAPKPRSAQDPLSPEIDANPDAAPKMKAVPEPEFDPRQSMITHYGNGQFHVSGDFRDNSDDLVTMNDLSYAIAKRETALQEGDDKRALIMAGKEERLRQKLADAGWEIQIFEGKSGTKNQVDDKVGFVAYNAQTNKMAVIFHGSQSSADWETNFDFVKRSARDEGIDLDGKYHRGFLQKYASAKESMVDAIRYFTNKLPLDKLYTMLTFVSGHSQGGALATLAAGDLAINIMPKILGKDFVNAVYNRVQLWSLSGARVADREAAEQLNTMVGAHNMVRQNPLHDPVPNVAMGRSFEALLEKIPVFGEVLAREYAGYASVGTLAMARDYETFAEKEFWNAARKWVQVTFSDYKEAFKKIFTGKSLSERASLFKAVLSAYRRGITGLVAPLHQGGVLEDNGGAFAPDVVNRDFERMLYEGWHHKKDSANSRGESYALEDSYGSDVDALPDNFTPIVKPRNPVVIVAEQAKDYVVDTVKEGARTVKDTVKKGAEKVKDGVKKLKFW